MSVDEQAKQQKHWEGRKRGSNSDKWMIYNSFDCFGWNNGKECCLDLLSSKNVDFLLIQEHWLFEQQFRQLMINDDYLFTAICGMDSDTPMTGRPYGGCCIFYKKSLAGCISICSTRSKHVNAIVVQLADRQLFIANANFPTNDGTVSSKVNLNDTLGEIEGLLASQQFDYLLVAGEISHVKQPLVRHFWILLIIIL